MCRERQDRERAERELRWLHITRGDADTVRKIQAALIAVIDGGQKSEVRSQKSEAGSRKRGRKD